MATSKKIKVLVSNESASYSSETIEYNDNKLKIVAQNGNAYSHLNVYVYTNNNELCQIANEYDIPGYKFVDYISDNTVRMNGNERNIKAAENYITKIF